MNSDQSNTKDRYCTKNHELIDFQATVAVIVPSRPYEKKDLLRPKQYQLNRKYAK